ncbi:2OG-Fe(II) oxygenase [uncultured Tateyamaria sp.]|uniref:HalD/BesD family halogenase n=1 Tax=uncultured Tateyamaria sp. TaxID=455651 RepID=UPI00261D28EE|nr:2OG-Fe(II) oxygenase [uncultured Tateyamaria sp.]
MEHILDLDRYPLDQPGSPEWQAMVTAAKAGLGRDGLFNLVGLMRPEAVEATLDHVRPRMATESFNHSRWHNIYFKDEVDGLAPDDPALTKVETANHTLCHDQMQGTALDQLYNWAPFMEFLAVVMDQPQLFVMDDPLSGLNVLEYRDGEALNWHFDRSIFTTTLLLQAPKGGGVFEYAQNLRSDDDPNHSGIADLLQGRMTPTQMPQDAGTLNVFLGRNTAHRVSRIKGDRSRIVAVLAHYDRPGARFSPSEQMGFFGRTA